MPGMLLVEIWVLSGIQMATKNDTWVWVPLRTGASVMTRDAHEVPVGAFGTIFKTFQLIFEIFWRISRLFVVIIFAFYVSVWLQQSVRQIWDVSRPACLDICKLGWGWRGLERLRNVQLLNCMPSSSSPLLLASASASASARAILTLPCCEI